MINSNKLSIAGHGSNTVSGGITQGGGTFKSPSKSKIRSIIEREDTLEDDDSILPRKDLFNA